MDTQIVLNRPDSPVIIITTTSYSPQSFSSGNHSAVSSCNSVQLNGQFIGNKGNMHEQQQQNIKNRICRDFVRGSCRRLYCKYPHVQSSDLVVFCHDFQNNKCPRVNCKWVKKFQVFKSARIFILQIFRFLHYSIEDEDHYRKFGEFPIAQDNFNGNQSSNNASINIQQHNEHSVASGFFSESNLSCSNRSLPSLLDGDLFHSCQQRVDSCGMHCHSDRGFSSSNSSVFRNGMKRIGSQDRECMQQSFKRCREDDIMVVLRRFDEDHQSLKRRVEANELKIAELRAANEYLMTQNAQLRLSTVQVSRVVNPVTVTHTQSQHHIGQGPQVINATMAPIQVSTPIVSMAASQTQIITAPQNMNGQPISISNTSQPTQILGTSQITLAPAALAPSISTPSIGLSINTSQALQAAISNASQPIISYPIMTHSILPHWLCLGGELKVERF